jgi:hypothetical protein
MSNGASASMTTSRASTIFSAAPVSISASAATTICSHASNVVRWSSV